MQSKIKIGGKLRPFKFGTNATRIICDKLNMTLGEYSNMFTQENLKKQNFKAEVIPVLIYSGLAAGCYSNNIEVDFNEWNVGDWIDDLSQKELTDIFEKMQPQAPKSAKKK